MTPRRRARQLALQILFQADIGKFSIEEALEAHRPGRPREDWPFITTVCAGVADHRRALDRTIDTHVRRSGWSLERMAAVDRNVLRMALYELEHLDTAPGVVISEAVALAKMFGGAESGRFVNGVLAAVHRERPSRSPAAPRRARKAARPKARTRR